MADDIAATLRRFGYVSPPRQAAAYGKMVGCDVLLAAADEIDRLRSEVIVWKAQAEELLARMPDRPKHGPALVSVH